MIKINPSAYSSVFIIPTEVADNHIRLAGAVQLKVLIWAFRHASQSITADDISSALGIPRADISDAVAYWVQAGILSDSENDSDSAITESNVPAPVKTQEIIFPAQPNNSSSNESAVSNEHVMPPAVRPTHEQIAARIAESTEVRDMFYEAQRIFGRTLGYDTQSSLLYLMDHEGLPAEVIVMLCGYAQASGKKSVRYIEKMGEDWAQREIDTFDKAAKRIAQLDSISTVWNELKSMIGLDTPKPTARQSEYISKWTHDYGYNTDMIYFAYERMTEKTGKISFAYMDKMISSWYASGLKTPEAVEKNDAQFREKTAGERSKQSSKGEENKPHASYDINKAFGSYEVPTKTKKGQ